MNFLIFLFYFLLLVVDTLILITLTIIDSVIVLIAAFIFGNPFCDLIIDNERRQKFVYEMDEFVSELDKMSSVTFEELIVYEKQMNKIFWDMFLGEEVND